MCKEQTQTTCFESTFIEEAVQTAGQLDNDDTPNMQCLK